MPAASPLKSDLATRVSNPPPPGLLFDQFGKAYASAFDPPHEQLGEETDKIARAVFRDTPIVSIAAGEWSIQRLSGALRAHVEGEFWMAGQLADALFGDDRVQATLASRTGGLFSQPLTHKIRIKTPNSRACRRAWKKAWSKLANRAVMSEIVRWIVMAGFCVAEIQWDRSVTPWQPYLKPWPMHLLRYDTVIRKYVANTQDGPLIVEPGNGKWVLFAPHGAYRGYLQGAIRAIANKWLIKELAWQSLSRFNDRHGLPVILARVPAAGDPQQKANFIGSMRTMGQAAVIGLPENVDGTKYDVELLEARDRAYGCFIDTITLADQAITLSFLGQELTTSMPKEGGSYAAARVHGDVRQNIIAFDGATISEDLYEQVARPFAHLNFGDADAATYSSWKVDPPEDFDTRAATFLKVAQGVSYLRQAGACPKDIGKFLRQFEIKSGDIESVDPVQVQARMAGAAGPKTEEALGKLIEFNARLDDIDRRLQRAA
jgi:Protein of unknown function (DUF935)